MDARNGNHRRRWRRRALIGAAALAVGAASPAWAVSPGAHRQYLHVNWSAGKFTGHDSADFLAPGIGDGQVLCSRYAQWVSFRPSDLSKRANMWVIRKRGDITAVKANRLDYPRTGREYNEGMNEVANDLEDEGSFTGIISLRPGANEAGGPGPAPTVFQLSWKWRFGAQGDSCDVNGVATSPPVVGGTEALASLTINWQHGSPGGRDGDAANLPGLGTLHTWCNYGSQKLSLDPNSNDSSLSVTVYEGEGTQNTIHRTYTGEGSEPLEVQLPPNGMITATLGDGGGERATLVMSSEHELNHDENRDLNQCYVAGQVVTRL